MQEMHGSITSDVSDLDQTETQNQFIKRQLFQTI